MQRIRRTMLALALIAVAVVPVMAVPVAAQDEPRALEVVAMNVTAEEEGRETDLTKPGDVIEMRLTFTNLTEGQVRNVVFDNPVPASLEYVGESAGADTEEVRVEYSVDEGASYSEAPTVTVVEAGREVRRPAAPEQVTHVRWTLLGGVAPGAQVTASFRARVAGGATR